MMARWTDLAEWVGPTKSCGDGDGVSEPGDHIKDHMYVVEHIAAGTYAGTIAWQRNPKARVSSHFIVAKDGRAAQMVDTAIRAWTQNRGNPYSLSIENEGQVGDALTPQQIEVSARILARAHQVHGIPLQVTSRVGVRGLAHHSMGAESGVDWGHDQCPGSPIKAQKPLILARAIALTQGGKGMAGETGYSPATATALAVGATDEGWVDQDTSPGWDNSLRRYNLRRLMTGGDVELPDDEIARYNLRALAKQLDGVKQLLEQVQVTPTDAQWAALLEALVEKVGSAVEAALGVSKVKAGTLAAFREIGANIPPAAGS
jgi:hypothetical protein